MDETVSKMLQSGNSMEEIVAQLSAEKEFLKERLDILEKIAPKRLRLSDGTIIIWRCADEEIPIETIF